MQRRPIRGLAGALAILAGAAAHAGDTLPADRAQGRAAASNSAPAQTSAFEGYRPYAPEEALQDWRRANDDVGRLGGHAGQIATAADGGDAREGDAQMPASPAPHHGGHR